MTISGIGGNTNTGAVGMGNHNVDAYSKSLKKQIADAQKSLQELSQNGEMDADTKMKKRQEIQKQISDLNMQLRQHQIEERRKAQQEQNQKNQLMKSDDHASGLSKNSMEAVISADHSLKQAKLQGNTAHRMQNSAEIKRVEIKLDGGGSTRSSDDDVSISSKWDEVDSMEQHAEAATASQISLLAGIQTKLNEANAEDGMSAEPRKKSGEKAKTETEGKETTAAAGTGAAEAAGAADRSEQEETAPVSNSFTKQSAAVGSSIDVKA